MPSSFIFFWSFLNALSLWLATCLAVFYCMKIIDFTQPFLVKMKLRISRMVPQLVLGSVLAALLASLPYILLKNCYYYCNETKAISVYRNGTSSILIPNNLISAIIYIMGTFPSFIIFLVSSIPLINSLLRHFRKMKQNTEGFRDQRMDVHVKAIKNLISFLLLYSASFASEISLTLLSNPWTIYMSIAIVSAYHSGHAIILIVINSKLKKTLSKVLCGSMDHSLGKTLPSSPKMPEETLPC
ncbi:taste receptor type 2 member 38-like [Hemicordylus capensis]|uniref:taste receptor type 2 member 38-like n=1 Tax=Hemicordylus capensis TaxID=884348 RepID=UPI002303CA0D|nr:taste receptor type 2 member 38-like [Hemicordylus capensis]